MPIGNYSTLNDTGWVLLPMAAGWVDYDNSGVYTPRYRRIGSIVFIRGLARSSAANSSGGYIPIAAIPAGNRPFGLHTVALWGSNGFSPLIFTDDGQILIGGPISLNFAQWVNYSYATP